ncbi:MAG TPA: hypothetical protein VH986_11955 [Acidimicrobiia bacterium]
MQLDLATVLVQVATGGLAFCWVTTRRREVGLGYGWLLRITFGVLAALGVLVGLGDAGAGATVRNVGAALMVAGATAAQLSSTVRRRAGVSGQRAARAARAERVAQMVGAARDEDAVSSDALAEFDPRLDLAAPIAGVVALAGAASFVGGDYVLSLVRLEIGAFFLGAVTDAMLLGHWYLVQPGLARDPIKELVKLVAALWPLELAVWLVPTGMVSVLNGTIDDGYGGLIGWMWLISAFTTIGLVVATWFALKERAYSAVMAATGLLYLAILTGFGMDLLPRAVLS